jgi:radical SAM protein
MRYDDRPFIAIWEVTQACDLVCAHCRACAQPQRDPEELSTAEAFQLIDEIAALQVPVFVISGGDPLKRPDIYEIVEYATRRGVRASLTPSATPLLTREAIGKLKERGLVRLAVSLDGSTAAIHDAFRGVPGSFAWTLRAIRWAREIGLPVQINTTITRRNLEDVEPMLALLGTLDICLWSVFFLVPIGRGQRLDLPSAEEFEAVFGQLEAAARWASFDIKTTEAPHYRRYLQQQQTLEKRANANAGSAARPPAPHPGRPVRSADDGLGRAPRGINDGKGFVFISHRGDVYPSGFLPMCAGNIRRRALGEIYRESPLFLALRDTSRLEGKCGRCEYREICGGSRARAFALTGNPLAEEPCCVYEPDRAGR